MPCLVGVMVVDVSKLRKKCLAAALCHDGEGSGSISLCVLLAAFVPVYSASLCCER